MYSVEHNILIEKSNPTNFKFMIGLILGSFTWAEQITLVYYSAVW